MIEMPERLLAADEPSAKISAPVLSAPGFSRCEKLGSELIGSGKSKARQSRRPSTLVNRETACRRVSHQPLVASALLRVSCFCWEGRRPSRRHDVPHSIQVFPDRGVC